MERTATPEPLRQTRNDEVYDEGDSTPKHRVCTLQFNAYHVNCNCLRSRGFSFQ